MKLESFYPTLGLWLLLVGNPYLAAAEPEGAVGKRRILITNDNGIDDPKLIALARAISRTAETWVVAPDRDQSGTGARLTLTDRRELTARPRDIGDGIQSFAVEGTPGDCVLLALSALMRDSPPDLVISGINGGPNLGMDWMYSGTIGAARVAAFGGLPSLAVSGLDDDLPNAVEAAVNWVVKLSSSEVIHALKPGEYLTASLPRVAPTQIRGVKVVHRTPGLPVPELATDDNLTWKLTGLVYPRLKFR